MPLEQFYKDSIATGIKVGEDLRGQVRQAIETLGNGFLDGDLIRRLQDPSPLRAGGLRGGKLSAAATTARSYTSSSYRWTWLRWPQ